jgi:Uma2 family endonuclease
MTFTATKLLSFEEYLAYDDGAETRYELVNGQLEPMNPPTFRHLFISQFIMQQFLAEIRRLKSPWHCLSEAGVRIGWRKLRLTDVGSAKEVRMHCSSEQSARWPQCDLPVF